MSWPDRDCGERRRTLGRAVALLMATFGALACDGENSPLIVDETAIIANAGLNEVVAYDEPSTLSNPATPSRATDEPLLQPYAVALDEDGSIWVVENVGDPGAMQPAGHILRYAPFDLSEPEDVFDGVLSYPTDLAIGDDGRIWIANSGLDWTGTPRGGTSITTIAPGANVVSAGFTFDNTSFGYPLGVALDSNGDVWLTTTYGLLLMFASPVDEIGGMATPEVIIVGFGGMTDFFDELRDVVLDDEDDVVVSASLRGQGRVIEIARDSWATGGAVTTLEAADVVTELTSDLYGNWGIAFGENGDLWVVNSTDPDDNADSTGSLLRFASDVTGTTFETTPTLEIDLDSRFTLSVAVGRP